MAWTTALVTDHRLASLTATLKWPAVLLESGLMLAYDVFSFLLETLFILGVKLTPYCIGKVFISSQLWGHSAYMMLRWHSTETSHMGPQLCCCSFFFLFTRPRCCSIWCHSLHFKMPEARNICNERPAMDHSTFLWWGGESGCGEIWFSLVLDGCHLSLRRKDRCECCQKAMWSSFCHFSSVCHCRAGNKFQRGKDEHRTTQN